MRAEPSVGGAPRAAALLQALTDLGVTTVGAGAWALTVPFEPVLSAVDAYRALSEIVPGGAVLWAEPARRPGVTGVEPWSFAGAGESACVVGSGAERIAEVRMRAERLLSRLTDACEVPDPVPPPALFGGLAFRCGERAGGRGSDNDDGDRGSRWEAFGEARFALPRWLYATTGARAFLRLVLAERPDAEEMEALLEETRRVVATLTRPAAASRLVGRARIWMHELPGEGWTRRVDAALAAIRAGELAKVVAATRTRLVSSAPFDAGEVLSRLDARQPGCIRFAFAPGGAEHGAAGCTFLGATPERLVDKRGRVAHLDALAGTVRRDASNDAASLRRLLESDKDRREHAYVVEFLREALRPVARVTAPPVPDVRTVRNLHHLWTPVRATLAPDVHVLDLVERLHPTPAVCGVPREAALAWIDAHEPAPRGWYAGAVGWFDAEGDGSFAVAIRSALLLGRRAWVHAGAGIVEGSVAAAEHAEVRLKQATTLWALGARP